MPRPPIGARLVDGKLVGVPVGGPYTIRLTLKEGDRGPARGHRPGLRRRPLGPGRPVEHGGGGRPDRRHAAGSAGRCAWGWTATGASAEEPLHWLVDSPDPVHSGDPDDRAERSAEAAQAGRKGAGLGLPFAVALVEQTGVPIGLVACAHGGTSMEQWNPAKKGEGGNSLYGSMLRQVQARRRQGQGRALVPGRERRDRRRGLRRSTRRSSPTSSPPSAPDLNQPELPFYYVQIGRFVNADDPKGWNAVQDAQRRLPERVPNTAVVSVIDLELDDLIHVGTQGLKRTGPAAGADRRARALRPGRRAPRRRSTASPAGRTTPCVVKFKGVNMRIGLRPGGWQGMGG